MERRRAGISFFILSLMLVPNTSFGVQLSESFTSSKRKGNSDMVWNTGRGELHPPIIVNDWDDQGTSGFTPIDLGNGTHGAFVRSRYSVFSENGNLSGQVIRINTDTYPELQFTTFNLEAGWTIRPVGSRPLVIKVLGTVDIAGDIDCSGEPGADAVTDPSVSLEGGRGRCGGGNGGRSVEAGESPDTVNQGTSGGSLATVDGGEGGPESTGAGGFGGGGGGAHVKVYALVGDPLNSERGFAPGGAQTGGRAGFFDRDDSFELDIDGAGSGGGGGSAFDGLAAQDSSGGSGGGGGGNIRIYAGDVVTVDGTINANGGDGGRITDVARLGGGGGGGGGGSILIISPEVWINNLGAVTALGGSRGTSTAGGSGGAGSDGRTWTIDNGGYNHGMAPDPDTQLSLPGFVQYEDGVTYDVFSNAIDLLTTKPFITLTSILSIGSPDVPVYELAFSNSDDLASLSDFADATTYHDTEQKRFARFHITVTNSDPDDPVRITLASIAYDNFTQDEYNFTSGCGRVSSSMNSGGGSKLLWMLVLLLPLFFVLGLRRRFKFV